jgi:hypothetical protein
LGATGNAQTRAGATTTLHSTVAGQFIPQSACTGKTISMAATNIISLIIMYKSYQDFIKLLANNHRGFQAILQLVSSEEGKYFVTWGRLSKRQSGK